MPATLVALVFVGGKLSKLSDFWGPPQSLSNVTDPLAALQEFGPKLISVLTSDSVVALNRAAAADPSGELGRIIAEAGRGLVAPQLAELFAQAIEVDHPAQVTEIFLGLLLGDLQIRRVVGQMPPPDATEARQRADRALEMLLRLFTFCPAQHSA